MAVLVASYDVSNLVDGNGLSVFADYPGRSQAFQVTANCYVESVTLYVKKYGSPTGTCTARIYPDNGTGTYGTDSEPANGVSAYLEESSTTYDVSAISNSAYDAKTFSFAGTTELEADTTYHVALMFTGGDTTNFIMAGRDNTSPSHEGNYGTIYANWTAAGAATSDIIFYVYAPDDSGTSISDGIKPKITDSITWTSTFGVGDDLKPMLADTISIVSAVVIAVGAGSLSPAGTLGNTALFIEYMGASSTTPAGAVAKQTSKPMSAAVTGAGAVAKQTNKTTSASLSPTASTEEQFVSLNYPGQGSITPVGSLAKLTSKLWGGAVTAAGGLAKQITKLAGGGILNPIGSFPITRLIAVGAGALTATGNAVAAIVSVVVSYGGGRLNRGRYSHKR